MNLIEAAAKYIGRRETHGKNRSFEIDKLNKWIGRPMGSPYCATGCSRLLFECAQEMHKIIAGPIPRTASSVSFRNWFIDRSLLSYDPQALLEWEGAFGGWTNEDGKHGHVFLIEKRYTTWWNPWNRYKVVAIGTIEFNTDGAGSRDGDGIWRRKRKITEKKFWYCNASDLPGGQYWNA